MQERETEEKRNRKEKGRGDDWERNYFPNSCKQLPENLKRGGIKIHYWYGATKTLLLDTAQCFVAPPYHVIACIKRRFKLVEVPHTLFVEQVVRNLPQTQKNLS